MKKELFDLASRIENVSKKKLEISSKINLYNSSKSGFMSCYHLCSIFIFSLSFTSIILSYILPSYIVGYLALFINSILVSFLIYLISENTNNLRVLKKMNLNNMELELISCNKEISKYDNDYKRIVETVMLGDDI